MKPLKAIVAAFVVILLAGCTTSERQGTSPTANPDILAPVTLMGAVTEEYPDCMWETFSSTLTFRQRSITFNANRWFMEDLARSAREVKVLEVAPRKLAQPKGISTNWLVCNTTGISIADFGQKISAKNLWSSPSLAWDSDFWPGLFREGWGGSCWSPGSGKPDSTEIALLRVCERRIVDKTRPGVWFLIQVGQDFEANRAKFESQNTSFQTTEAATPTAFVDQFVFSVEAPFDYLTRPAIDNLDRAWQRIVGKVAASKASDLLPGYPDSFDRSQWNSVEDRFPERGTRMDLENAYSIRFDRHLACNESLEISEFSYTPGGCGKLKVKVFQADLTTGECMFLGKWNDKNGKQKTGLFEFCSAFRAGSIVEGDTYKLKVRVQGQTSYVTRLGYEKDVLSFSVLGDY